MIKWIRLEPGEYESEDQRFHILKTWNRVYGNHWQLQDRNEESYYKGQYHEQSLMGCKLKAEALLRPLP